MNSLINSIRANFQPFVLSSLIFGSCTTTYLWYVTKQNYDDHIDKLQNEQQVKDTTRPQYEYFGINWGYRADAIIKDKLDTGDILFMNYNCTNCISIKELLQCQMMNFFKPYPHYDSIGLVYRDEEGVFIIYNRFGQIIIQNYVALLCEPFWDHLSVRKLKVNNSIKAKQLQKTIQLWFDQIQKQQITIHQQELLADILQKLDVVADKHLDNIQQFTIEDLDQDQPHFFRKQYSLATKIIIRSKSNKDLQG